MMLRKCLHKCIDKCMDTVHTRDMNLTERIAELKEAIADLERAGADATADRAKLAKLEAQAGAK